jgi:hypothetical protein
MRMKSVPAVLFAATMLAEPSAAQVSPKVANEFAAPIGNMFDRIIVNLAKERMTNRSVGFLVTDRFDELLGVYMLSQLREYLSYRFKMKKVRDWSGFYEVINLGGAELVKLDSRFSSYDEMSLIFKESNNWVGILEFRADFGDVRG